MYNKLRSKELIHTWMFLEAILCKLQFGKINCNWMCLNLGLFGERPCLDKTINNMAIVLPQDNSQYKTYNIEYMSLIIWRFRLLNVIMNFKAMLLLFIIPSPRFLHLWQVLWIPCQEILEAFLVNLLEALCHALVPCQHVHLSLLKIIK